MCVFSCHQTATIKCQFLTILGLEWAEYFVCIFAIYIPSVWPIMHVGGTFCVFRRVIPILWQRSCEDGLCVAASSEHCSYESESYLRCRINPRMSTMWQMMITWGKSMTITTLLMVPLQEQHPSTCDSGWIHRQRRSFNLEPAVCQVVWERAPGKQTNKNSCICYIMPLLTSNRPKTSKKTPALSFPAFWEQPVSQALKYWIADREREKGEGVK